MIFSIKNVSSILSLIQATALECFECDSESNHICITEGMQVGRKVNCTNDENACAKHVGGTILRLL